jgi:hypothetical protein
MYYTYTGGVIDIEELHDIEKHATPCPVSERFPLHIHTPPCKIPIVYIWRISQGVVCVYNGKHPWQGTCGGMFTANTMAGERVFPCKVHTVYIYMNYLTGKRSR